MPHLTRRTLLASTAVMAGGAALAQSAPPARAKGPLVWLDLDQKELDDAYDQSVYAPNLRQITGRYVTNSEAVRARIGAPKRLAYGSTPIEGLDLYATKTPNAPVQVFIHGGAWRAGLAKDYATPAEMFVGAGAHFVVLDFNNVIETNGDRCFEAELYRLRGEALAHDGVTAAAIGDVQKATSIATAQRALGLSRRAAASLSRLQTKLP